MLGRLTTHTTAAVLFFLVVRIIIFGNTDSVGKLSNKRIAIEDSNEHIQLVLDICEWIVAMPYHHTAEYYLAMVYLDIQAICIKFALGQFAANISS